MSASGNTKKVRTAVARIGVTLAPITGLAFSGTLTLSTGFRWGAMIVLGEFALLLMGFQWPAIVDAIRQAGGRRSVAGASQQNAYFWEAAARNALHLGVLGTLIGFVMQICSDMGGQAGFMAALGSALLSTVFGLILAAVLSTLALRSLRPIGTDQDSGVRESVDASPDVHKRAGRLVPALGWIMFLALMLYTLYSPAASGAAMPFDWFVHWPAWLVVFGGALILGLMSGHPLSASPLVTGFAWAGLIGSLLGVVQALQGFSQMSIAAVSEGITFMISSCFAGFIGLLAIGLPLQDRSQNRQGMKPSRLVWYGFPIVALLILALATLMVMVPIKIENS
jgi:hypothetical protein